ncbi:hypothetical protein [Streptosporangium amethystogenes]|uniref:hypothetical protein n=1 Tax=Streptosporangium amethystogenes TaxID=2002 RepID=UPI0012F899C5|nr:hypothetical protein [Streptosporangium amethystogenes]
MTKVAGWGREFRLWHYTVSYSQLLLRSIDINDSTKRIDLLFSNVERMQVSSEYNHLTIEEFASSTDPKLSELGLQVPKFGKIFLINGGPDFVTATHCQWHEDDGDARSPSKFGPLRGTD